MVTLFDPRLKSPPLAGNAVIVIVRIFKGVISCYRSHTNAAMQRRSDYHPTPVSVDDVARYQPTVAATRPLLLKPLCWHHRRRFQAMPVSYLYDVLALYNESSAAPTLSDRRKISTKHTHSENTVAHETWISSGVW